MVHRDRLILLCLLGALASCKRKARPVPDAGPPVDHLAVSEDLESRDAVYALALPRASSVAFRFDRTSTVLTPLSAESLSNFVEKRVTGGKVVRGTSSTTFEDVASPKEPARKLTIEVRPAHGAFASELVVKDTTPPPNDPKLTEDQRWKAVGLTPDGKVIDREHMQ